MIHLHFRWVLICMSSEASYQTSCTTSFTDSDIPNASGRLSPAVHRPPRSLRIAPGRQAQPPPLRRPIYVAWPAAMADVSVERDLEENLIRYSKELYDHTLRQWTASKRAAEEDRLARTVGRNRKALKAQQDAERRSAGQKAKSPSEPVNGSEDKTSPP